MARLHRSLHINALHLCGIVWCDVMVGQFYGRLNHPSVIHLPDVTQSDIVGNSYACSVVVALPYPPNMGKVPESVPSSIPGRLNFSFIFVLEFQHGRDYVQV